MTSCSSEFDLIARHFAPLAGAGAFGLEDDAALVPQRAGHDIVVTTDTIVEGVDFFANDPAETVAKKALRVNLSDLAAKGAEPAAYLLSLTLPRAEEAWLAAFARGLAEDQRRYGLSLLGGDTGSTPGPLSIAIAAFGHVPSGGMIRRSRARAGDAVYVTGTIGDGGGGLALLKGEGSVSAAHRDHLVGRYRVPEPPVGFHLQGLASAAIDVSDGLLADLGHVAEASGLRIVVEAARVPRSDALTALWGGDILRAATAGDDYQIAFTSPAGIVGHDLVAVTRIGRVEEGAGVALLDAEGREIAVPRAGFTHF